MLWELYSNTETKSPHFDDPDVQSKLDYPSLMVEVFSIIAIKRWPSKKEVSINQSIILFLPKSAKKELTAIGGFTHVIKRHQNALSKKSGRPLTLSLPRSSIDDLVFSVFTSKFFKFSYKISLIKNRFVTLFFIRFS